MATSSFPAGCRLESGVGYQATAADTDHFNRDFKPEYARGGTEICRLDPADGSIVPLTSSPPRCGTFASANRRAATRSSFAGPRRVSRHRYGSWMPTAVMRAMDHSLTYATTESVTEPASSPAALAVGAACWQTGQLEDYSSLGPTIDGRPKPDLTAPDSVSTVTYGAAVSGSAGCGDVRFHGNLGRVAAGRRRGRAAVAAAAEPHPRRVDRRSRGARGSEPGHRGRLRRYRGPRDRARPACAGPRESARHDRIRLRRDDVPHRRSGRSEVHRGEPILVGRWHQVPERARWPEQHRDLDRRRRLRHLRA